MPWKLAIIAASAMAALALGLSAQAATDHTDLQALMSTAWAALS